MIATATELGFKKLAGFFCSGLGATYTTTVTPGTGVISSFRILKRPISGTAANIAGIGGASGSVSFTETNDIEFELEVWGNVKTVGTFTITSTSTGNGQGSAIASYATDANGNVTGIAGSDGGVIDIIDEQVTPIICIGSDHPYLQLYGTNGNNGMFGVYADNGMPTYNAICWDTEAGNAGHLESSFSDINGITENFLSIAQAKELQAKGLEFVSHGVRHPSEWDRLNTGITIDYLGVAASATVLINGNGNFATEIVFVGNGGAENTTLTLTSYATLDELKTAIDSIAGGGVWQCQYANELTGSENPKLLWPIAAARTVTGGTGRYNNRRFSMSGGIKLQYTGSIYRNITATIDDGGNFKIYADGVKAASYDPTTQSISSMITSIKASMVTFGISATDFFLTLMNNASPSPNRETYIQGDELARYLPRTVVDCCGRFINITYGLPLKYVIRRQFEALNAKADANGIVIKNIAQSGTSLHPSMISDVPYGEWRLDSVAFGQGVASPYAMPANKDVPWHTMTTVTSAITLAEFKSTVDAIIDSGAWAVDFLIHKIQPDGTTGYSFPTNDFIYYDMIEADFVAGVQYLGSKKSQGLVDVKAPDEFRVSRRKRAKPKNLAFNPRFLNREIHGGEAILGAVKSFGWAIAGWESNFPTGAGNISSMSIADGVLTIVTNGAISSDLTILRQNLWLDRGVPYDIGFEVDASDMTAGSVACVMRADYLRPAGMPISSNTKYIIGGVIYPASHAESKVTFTRENLPEWSPERVMSKVGPFNLVSTPCHFNVNYLGIGLVADINIAGATPTATTAKEIASAINAAVSANAAYALYPELHSAARAERGRVILEVPYRNVNPLVNGIACANGTTNGQGLVVFGSSLIQSAGTVGGASNAGIASYAMEITLQVGANGTIKIYAPFAQEVTI